MTVIAWDGKTLAADRQSTGGAGLKRSVSKISKHKMPDGTPYLLGMTGDESVALELREWFNAGADPGKFPSSARDDASTLVVIAAAGGISMFTSGPYPLKVDSPQFAWGSGRDFALASMHLGMAAIRACEVACVFQSDCGMGIDDMTLED